VDLYSADKAGTLTLLPSNTYENEKTFGKTIDSTSDAGMPPDSKWACKFALAEPGTVTKMVVRLRNRNVGQTTLVRYGIYSDSNGPNVLLGSTVEGSGTDTTSWLILDMTEPVSLEAGTYCWL
jgi:hypothetical protein